MLELGEKEKKYHFDVGLFFAKLGFSKLITVGKLSEEIANGAKKGGFPSDNIISIVNVKDAVKSIGNIMNEAVILFKSSRDSGLNEIVEKLYGQK
jgi:UDP-N-acetylmuramoyl-tripeptide--D-alanyl-D-alanine ligase